MTIIIAALFACSGGKDSAGEGGGDATAGAEVYSGTCEGCHGPDGTLGVEIGGEASADLTVEVPEQTDAQLTDIISNGYGTMPAQSLSETEIADCIAYLRATFP